jgi:hypothetical protein
MTLELEPGEVADVADGDWRLHADRIRIWAETDDGQKWLTFKNKTLRLVPETDAEGNHVYLAPACDTFVFTVTPQSLKFGESAAKR